MRMRMISILVICLSLMVLFVSCKPSAPAQEDTVTPQTTRPTAAVIDEKLDEMLTAKEISDAVGVEMGAPTVSGQGTILTSVGVDTKTALNVIVAERPIEAFYGMMQNYTALQPCPNLGETAWFDAVHNQLLVYGNGFMITVELTGVDDSDQIDQMIRCRQIAALLLEHL